MPAENDNVPAPAAEEPNAVATVPAPAAVEPVASVNAENDELQHERIQLQLAQMRRDRILADEEYQLALAKRQQRFRRHEESAFYTLRERMYGKRMDANWKSFAANVVTDYLDQNNVIDPKERVQILERVVENYLSYLASERHLQVVDIMNIQDHNTDLEGRINQARWWNPWSWHKNISIQGNENGSWREHSLYSFSQVAITTSLEVGAVAIAGYLAFKACCHLKSYIITPKITPQPTLPIQIAIPSVDCLTTSLVKLADSINTSANSVAIPTNSLENNTSTVLIVELGGRCINALLTGLSMVVESAVEYARSPR